MVRIFLVGIPNSRDLRIVTEPLCFGDSGGLVSKVFFRHARTLREFQRIVGNCLAFGNISGLGFDKNRCHRILASSGDARTLSGKNSVFAQKSLEPRNRYSDYDAARLKLIALFILAHATATRSAYM